MHFVDREVLNWNLFHLENEWPWILLREFHQECDLRISEYQTLEYRFMLMLLYWMFNGFEVSSAYTIV